MFNRRIVMMSWLLAPFGAALAQPRDEQERRPEERRPERPEPRHEERPPPPGREGWRWREGEWTWNGRSWVWLPGRWFR